jgi:TetR/AcrR family transcriptional regulator, cholesterol catabolism regulator
MKETVGSRDSHPPAVGLSKEAVLEAAQRLIVERGYAGLSMRELAQESGLAKATLYHHFHDKRSIYSSVLARDLEVVCERLGQAAAEPGDLALRLRAVIHTYLALHEERHLVILQALRESGGDVAELGDLIRRYRDRLLAPVMDLLGEAIDARLVRPINVEMAVMSLFGMLNSFVLHRRLMADIVLDGEVIDHALDLFLHGILTPTQSDIRSHCPAPHPRYHYDPETD